jgi:L-gulonolactone oxidase
MGNVWLQNWKGEITYRAASVEEVHSVEDVARIVKDKGRYPSPVRVRGSHHSTTRCVVAEGGTVIDVRKMNRILDIDVEGKTITMQPGVLHIDAARELEKHGLQFYVNIELGNLTVGSGACTATKDASYYSEAEGKYEYGQVNSYCIRIKAVQPDGSILEVTEDDGELMEAMRSSYGMLGVVVEVTYRVKELKPMRVAHESYHVDEFADRLDELIARNRSMMLYLGPLINRVTVEYRFDGSGTPAPRSWQWAFRNTMWKTVSPTLGRTITTIVPGYRVRGTILRAYDAISLRTLLALQKQNTSPADQIIRYSEKGGYGAYTFSIWAFSKAEYPQTIRAYFKFCQDFYRQTGYRCDLINVGYHIAQDRSSLFSYTRDWSALTLDPVSSGSRSWPGFIEAYNTFCSSHDGRPLLNQTPQIKPVQVKKAFAKEIPVFLKHRSAMDPDGRFYNDFFRELFE